MDTVLLDRSAMVAGRLGILGLLIKFEITSARDVVYKVDDNSDIEGLLYYTVIKGGKNFEEVCEVLTDYDSITINKSARKVVDVVIRKRVRKICNSF